MEYNSFASAHAWRSSAANHGWSDQPLRTGDLALRHPATAEQIVHTCHEKESRLSQQDRLNIAVFIDFDNIEIGVRTTLSEHFDVGTVLEALKERGEVVTKIAYADWTRAGEYSRALTQHAIRLVQRNLTPGGDKNGADINLALDALEMAFTHPHINAYVIVGGDSEFLSLVEKLKQYDKKVFVVGGRAFTSVILQRNCHEFIAYENLARKPAARGGWPDVRATATAPIAQAFPIVRRALKILADREVTPQTGLLKSTLLQLDSTFSERNYGASSFLDFAEKLAKAGLVQLKHAGRSVTVELNPGFVDDGDAAATTEQKADSTVRTTPEAGADRSGVEATTNAAQPFRPSGEAPVAQVGNNADGVKLAGQLLAAATTARWPMYLRNAKQILRAGAFDERRYGFGGLMDLLRACQKEGLIRLERDRRGGLRVFQGSALKGSTTPRVEPTEGQGVEAGADPGNQSAQIEAIEAETIAPVPVAEADMDVVEWAGVIDTTAELLGRATSRRPRARTSGQRKAPVKKAPSIRRASRAKKSPASANDENA
jgi:uncharacterized LabA/DUF88 family protein